MKLYTESQIREALDNEDFAYIANIVIAQMQPLELPNNVEVGKIVLGNSPIMEHRDSGYFAAGAMKYNKWLEEQILKNNL